MRDFPENRRFFVGSRFFTCTLNVQEEGHFLRENKASRGIIAEFILSNAHSSDRNDGEPLVFKPIAK
jgi:hypothetical protein